MVNIKFAFIKIPNTRPSHLPQQIFPKMSIMYLELLENKYKIKKNLAHKDFVGTPGGSPIISKEEYVADEQKKSIKKEFSPTTIDDNGPLTVVYKKLDKKQPTKEPFLPKPNQAEMISPEKDVQETTHDNVISPDRENKENDDEKDSDRHNISENMNNDGEDEEEEKPDPIQLKLLSMLGNDKKETYNKDNNKPAKISINSENKSDVKTTETQQSTHKEPTMKKQDTIPPRLSEIDKQTVLPAVESVSNIDIDEQKRTLLYKFDMLKLKYKKATIPEYTIHTELSVLQKEYDHQLYRLNIETSVESYRTYLMVGCFIIETLAGKINIDLSGYTQQQLLASEQYDRLLIELGEKSYVPTGSRYPVELRLLLLMLTNALLFGIQKVAMNKFGFDINGLMAGANNATNPNNNSSNIPKPVKKMNGPKVEI